MDAFHPDIQKALAAEEHQRQEDALRDILIKKAQRSTIEKDIAESYFATAAILYKPERRELPPDVKALARSIDNTYLTITHWNRFADVQNVVQLCREAGEWGMASVCVRPTKVALAEHLLARWGIDDIAVCTVINFPREQGGRGGIMPEKECVEEAMAAQRDGATEFDIVIDYEALLRGDPKRAYCSIADVAGAVKSRDPGAIVKAILETAKLRKHGGVLALSSACAAAIGGGADYLKTSTGYAPEGGATVEDVAFLHHEAEPYGVLVEASGGIKTLDQLRALQQAGASRFGLSASGAVMKEGSDAISILRYPYRGYSL